MRKKIAKSVQEFESRIFHIKVREREKKLIFFALFHTKKMHFVSFSRREEFVISDKEYFSIDFYLRKVWLAKK